jgi:arsenite methyltransferase
VSGALAERVFAEKLEAVGFVDLEVHERRPYSLDDAATYPLFTPELIAVARDVLAPDRQVEIATAVTVSVRKPPA